MKKAIRVRDMSQNLNEDMDCERCLSYHGKSRYRKNGCKRPICVCVEENLNTMPDGRNKRKRGGYKWSE